MHAAATGTPFIPFVLDASDSPHAVLAACRPLLRQAVGAPAQRSARIISSRQYLSFLPAGALSSAGQNGASSRRKRRHADGSCFDFAPVRSPATRENFHR